jgi:hypothetical protein
VRNHEFLLPLKSLIGMKNTKAQVLEVVGKQGFWKSEVTGELNQIFVKCLDDRLNCEEYTNCDAVKRREE